MARYTTTIDVDLPAGVVFRFLEDFTNAADWDPGVAAAERLDDGPVGRGARFALDLAVGPTTQRWVYVTEQHDPDRHVAFATRSSLAEGRDDVTVTPRGADACTVTWDATFRFTGLLGRLADPVFGVVFDRIAGRATDGLRDALHALEAA